MFSTVNEISSWKQNFNIVNTCILLGGLQESNSESTTAAGQDWEQVSLKNYLIIL